MRFPDDVTIVRPFGQDEYGNPTNSFADPTLIEARGFLVTPDVLLMPPTPALLDGDRVKVNGVTYTTEITPARSPSKTVVYTVRLSKVGAS